MYVIIVLILVHTVIGVGENFCKSQEPAYWWKNAGELLHNCNC